jgi:hypothetical protein
MPRGDRTGPAGMGPMTGRGMGYCAGYDAPGYASPGPGFGRGRGGWWGGGPGWRGGGRGWRHRYYATGVPGWAAWDYGPYAPLPTEAQETEMLKNQAGALQRELEAINKRLEELEKKE